MAADVQSGTLLVVQLMPATGFDPPPPRSIAMSATITPPEVVEAPLESAAPSLQTVAAPVRPRVGPPPSAPGSRTRKQTARVRDGLLLAACGTGLVVMSVIGALALAVAQPILIARLEYEQRRYR
jgi:hypothetical protein